jgi:hypothetical protein
MGAFACHVFMAGRNEEPAGAFLKSLNLDSRASESISRLQLAFEYADRKKYAGFGPSIHGAARDASRRPDALL